MVDGYRKILTMIKTYRFEKRRFKSSLCQTCVNAVPRRDMRRHALHHLGEGVDGVTEFSTAHKDVRVSEAGDITTVDRVWYTSSSDLGPM